MAIAKTMILFGGGGHAAVVTESARAAGFVVLGFLSDSPAEVDADQSAVMGLKPLGAIAEFAKVLSIHRHASGHAAVGDAALREQWLKIMEEKDVPLPPVIHPTAAVSGSAKLGEGVFIGPNAVVNARAQLGRGVIVNSGAIVEHDCQIETFSHIAPRAVLCGGVTVGRNTLIGAGAVVIPQVRIGNSCTLAAGAVANADVPDGALAIGVPARAVERA